MSEVISFRLDSHNPREAQALAFLNAWATRGYSVRQTITDALINFEESGITFSSKMEAEKITLALVEITQLING